MDAPKQEPGLSKEQKRQLNLIAELPKLESFVVWREQFCLPVLKQLRDRLRSPKDLSDIELRASIMHLNSLEALFETLFDNASFILEEEE